jgi:hypothetical protein
VSVDVQRPASPRDAKAELKAAKAYAKAQRPWFKKKRWWAAGLVALAVIGSVLNNGSSATTTSASSTSSATAQTSTPATPAKKKDDVKTGRVGETVANAGTTYEVTRVKAASTIGDPHLLGARADGKFVIVSLELTNNKDETKTFTDASAHIKTADGKKYETSNDAVMALGDSNLLLKEIQPELTAKGKLVFDLPPSKIAGSKLVIKDLWGDGEVTVDLGL